MTIATLVVDIAANQVNLIKGVEQVNGTLDKVVGFATKVAGALGLAFTAQAIISGIQRQIAAAIAYASTLTNLHAKTELSYRDLQILEDVGMDVGVSMQTLAGAVQLLQMRLGDGSARKGIDALHLSFDGLLAMGPAQQLTTIAGAIAQIEDPTRRAQVAAMVFGKTWKEMLPLLKANMAEAAAGAVIVGDKQIEAADRAGDRWAKFWNDHKRGWTSWAGDIILNVENVNAAKARLDAQMNGGMPTLPGAPKLGIGMANIVQDAIDPAMISQLKVAGMTLDEHTNAIKRRTAAMDAYATITKADAAGLEFAWQQTLALQHKMADFLPELESRVYRVNAALGPLHVEGGILPSLTSRTFEATQGFYGLVGALDSGKRTFDIVAPDWRTKLDDLSQAFATLGQIGGDGLSAVTRGIGSVVSGFSVAMTGLDSFKGGLKSLKSGDLLGGITGIMSGIGGIVGAAQAAISAVKALWRWAKGGEEGTVVNPARDAWFTAHGGLAGVNEAAFNATGNLGLTEAIFGASTKADFDAAIAAWHSATGLSTGTHGQFVDWGKGTPVVLHGKERVMTEAEGRSEGGTLALLRDELRADRLFQQQLLPKLLKAAMQQA